MSKIFFNRVEIWNKNHLPKEAEARKLLRQYAPSYAGNRGAELALSAGIDVVAQEGRFAVELSTDRLVIPGRMRK